MRVRLRIENVLLQAGMRVRAYVHGATTGAIDPARCFDCPVEPAPNRISTARALQAQCESCGG